MSEDAPESAFAARDRQLRQLGTVDDLLLAPLISRALLGGPRWPGREAWRTVRNPGRTLIVSDGLSDPFDESEPSVGFGLEIVAETDAEIPDPVQHSWLFQIVYHISHLAAQHGGLAALLAELGLLSTEIRAPAGLEELATPTGNVGLLLGVAGPGLPAFWQLPAGPVRLVTVKLLHPRELAFALQHDDDDEGRRQLRDRFAATGTHHLCSPERLPVV